MSSYILLFASTYVPDNVALLYGDFGMNSYSVNNDEVRRWTVNAASFQFSEALNASSLHRCAFLLFISHFISITF
jgi:hypothetical protein